MYSLIDYREENDRENFLEITHMIILKRKKNRAEWESNPPRRAWQSTCVVLHAYCWHVSSEPGAGLRGKDLTYIVSWACSYTAYWHFTAREHLLNRLTNRAYIIVQSSLHIVSSPNRSKIKNLKWKVPARIQARPSHTVALMHKVLIYIQQFGIYSVISTGFLQWTGNSKIIQLSHFL